MYVNKEIKIDFTKAEEDAILEMFHLTNAFEENCSGKLCDECPLEIFCGYNLKIDDFKKRLKNFLEEN